MNLITALRFQLVVFFALVLLGLAVTFTGANAKSEIQQNGQNVANTRAGIGPSFNGTLFDLLATELKPEFVSFELDVFWSFHGGQDPVALMRKYPKRFTLMHLKDMRKGEKGNLTGIAPDDWSVVLGAGQIDFPAVLREAKKIGVKWYFIEEESHTPLENVPAGLRYLEKVRF